jgi:hypothetical protein
LVVLVYIGTYWLLIYFIITAGLREAANQAGLFMSGAMVNNDTRCDGGFVSAALASTQHAATPMAQGSPSLSPNSPVFNLTVKRASIYPHQSHSEKGRTMNSL